MSHPLTRITLSLINPCSTYFVFLIKFFRTFGFITVCDACTSHVKTRLSGMGGGPHLNFIDALHRETVGSHVVLRVDEIKPGSVIWAPGTVGGRSLCSGDGAVVGCCALRFFGRLGARIGG